LRIDLEDDDVVGVLIRNQQELSRRIDDKVSRPLPLGRDVFDEPGLARSWVESEDDNAVVASV
jgi:hypothetical protein